MAAEESGAEPAELVEAATELADIALSHKPAKTQIIEVLGPAVTLSALVFPAHAELVVATGSVLSAIPRFKRRLEQNTRAFVQAGVTYDRERDRTRPLESSVPDNLLIDAALRQTERDGYWLRGVLDHSLKGNPKAVSPSRSALLYLLWGSSCQEGVPDVRRRAIDALGQSFEQAMRGRNSPLAAIALISRAALHRKAGNPNQEWLALRDLAEARALLHRSTSSIATMCLYAEEAKWAVTERDSKWFKRIKDKSAELLTNPLEDSALSFFPDRLYRGQLDDALMRGDGLFGTGHVTAERVERADRFTQGYSVWQAILPLTRAEFELQSTNEWTRSNAVRRLYHQIRYAEENGLHLHLSKGRRLMTELMLNGALPLRLHGPSLCDCGAHKSELVDRRQYVCSPFKHVTALLS